MVVEATVLIVHCPYLSHAHIALATVRVIVAGTAHSSVQGHVVVHRTSLPHRIWPIIHILRGIVGHS